MKTSKATLGVIVGNRDFFPDRLISEGRKDILELFAEMNIEAVMLDVHHVSRRRTVELHTGRRGLVCGRVGSECSGETCAKQCRTSAEERIAERRLGHVL